MVEIHGGHSYLDQFLSLYKRTDDSVPMKTAPALPSRRQSRPQAVGRGSRLFRIRPMGHRSGAYLRGAETPRIHQTSRHYQRLGNRDSISTVDR